MRARRPRSTTSDARRVNTRETTLDSQPGGPRASGLLSGRAQRGRGGAERSEAVGHERSPKADSDRPDAGETPAVHNVRRPPGQHTRDDPRLATRWTAGLWPAVRPTTQSTRSGRDARGPHHRRGARCARRAVSWTNWTAWTGWTRYREALRGAAEALRRRAQSPFAPLPVACPPPCGSRCSCSWSACSC